MSGENLKTPMDNKQSFQGVNIVTEPYHPSSSLHPNSSLPVTGLIFRSYRNSTGILRPALLWYWYWLVTVHTRIHIGSNSMVRWSMSSSLCQL
ncbi:hypothetical protein LINPERPRIM_LOCUS33761 [Linum perenne]